MTAPPWGHKPPAVATHYQWWMLQPPKRSGRCQYWLDRLNTGTWRPNKHFFHKGYDCAAQWLGVWIWEYLHVIQPRINELAKEATDEHAR